MGVDAVMIAASSEPVTDDDIREYSYRLASSLGASTYWIEPPTQHVLSRVQCDWLSEELQQLPTLLQVNWMMRYYGPGYERGDVSTIVTTAALLQHLIPRCIVYYGGDSAGLENLTPINIEMLLNHAATGGRDNYHLGFGSREPIALCNFCKHPMPAYSWAGPIIGYTCLGCGQECTIDKTTNIRTDTPYQRFS